MYLKTKRKQGIPEQGVLCNYSREACRGPHVGSPLLCLDDESAAHRPCQHPLERQVHKGPVAQEDTSLPVGDRNTSGAFLGDTGETPRVEFSRPPSSNASQCEQL